MKKLILSILIPIVFVGGLYAGWTEENGIDCRNDHYLNDLSVYNRIVSSDGIVNVRDVFDDVPAPSDNGYFDSDISTTALVAAATTFTGGKITQPYQSITLKALVTFDDGAATTTVTGTLLITGVNARGISTTETVTVSTTSAETNNAWSSITSLAWTVTAITGRETTTSASLQLGPADELGLSNAITGSSDAIGAMLNDGGTTTTETTITIDATYNTWDPSTDGDGTADVYTIIYPAKNR